MEWDEGIEASDNSRWNQVPDYTTAVTETEDPHGVLNLQDWDDVDFLSEVRKRNSTKITLQDFETDVMLFEAQIKSVARPNKREIVREVNNWDFSTPTKDCFSSDQVYSAYARMISYRHRLGQLYAVTQTYYELILGAHKSLKEMAMELTSAKTIPEKAASAGYRVRPFEQAAHHVSGIKNFLLEVAKTLDLMSMHLSSSLKHLDSVTRVNSGWERQGRASDYDRLSSPVEDGDDAVAQVGRSRPRTQPRT